VNWDDYRVLLAVARERTLSGAARRLGVDQSTIGRRLAALEHAANARLFDRTPEGYMLTLAGEAVLPSIEEIERAAIGVERTLVGHDLRLEGSVRVALSDSFAAWFVVPRLHALHAQHPGIHVDLVTGNQPVDLARREADLSLRMAKPEQPNLIARRIGSAAWALYASAQYLAARGMPDLHAGLPGHDVIGFETELRRTAGAVWLRDHAHHARVAFSTNSLLSLAAAVAAGLGVSPLPCLYGDVQPDLRPLAGGVIGHHEIWLVVHPDVRTSARVRLVMSFLTRLIEQEAQLIGGEQPGKVATQSKKRRPVSRARRKTRGAR
jgi:DNA-binding transcriptional LysR family regulator